ncbi:hypothetical protein HMPREF1600_00838, partial [Escherichia coli 907715]
MIRTGHLDSKVFLISATLYQLLNFNITPVNFSILYSTGRNNQFSFKGQIISCMGNDSNLLIVF